MPRRVVDLWCDATCKLGGDCIGTDFRPGAGFNPGASFRLGAGFKPGAGFRPGACFNSDARVGRDARDARVRFVFDGADRELDASSADPELDAGFGCRFFRLAIGCSMA